MKLHFRKIIFVLVSALLPGLALAQKYSPEVDSLMALAISAPDSSKARVNNQVAWKIRNFKPEVAIQYSMRAVEYANKFNNHLELVKGYSFTGVCHRNLGNYNDALEYYYLGLKTAQRYGITEQEAYAYVNLGNLYLYQENFKLAEENLINALGLARQLADSAILSYSYLNLGRTFLGRNMYSQAEDYLKKSLEVRLSSNSPKIQVLVVNKYIGDVYAARLQYDKAKSVYYKCLSEDVILTDCDLMADMSHKLSCIYFQDKQLDSALHFGKISLEYAKMVGTKYRIKDAYNAIANVYFAEENYKEAALCYGNQIVYNDSIFNEQLAQKIFDIQFSAEQYKKQTTINLMESEKNIRDLYIVILLIILVLGMVMAFLLIHNNRKVNKLNLQLQIQKDEILEKNNELSLRSQELATKRDELIEQNNYIEQQRLTLVKQQKQITDSIFYAHRIQSAMLPEVEKFGSYFSDKFIYYVPRDVVSGDFYWHFEDDSHEMLAIADCTGHGVPGAFMSMLGTSALHEIANSGERHSAIILERLREMVKTMLHQRENENSSKDGMDIALVVIDKKSNIMEYSGANISIVYIRDSQVFQLKATRNPIGIYLKESQFGSQLLQLKKGDCIYITTDGYCSQFGGEHNMRLKLGSFSDMLLKIHKDPMSEQREFLEKSFVDWKGRSMQIDDILVAGFRV